MPFLLNYISGTVRGCLIYVLFSRYVRFSWFGLSSCMCVRCPVYVVQILNCAYQFLWLECVPYTCTYYTQNRMQSSMKFMEDSFHLLTIRLKIGHCGWNRTVEELKGFLRMLLTKLPWFLSSLEEENKAHKKALAVKPMMFCELNFRCQTDPTDIQTQQDEQ
jgi:hypothetical protein